MITSKLNFLSAKKTPIVKWKRIINAEIAPATPKPDCPYANKLSGSPKFPVFGINKGGNSRIISFTFKKYNKETPTIKKHDMAIK